MHISLQQQLDRAGEETSHRCEKPSEYRVVDEVFYGPQWNTTAGAHISRNRPHHTVEGGMTDIPDKMYRFEVRTEIEAARY